VYVCMYVCVCVCVCVCVMNDECSVGLIAVNVFPLVTTVVCVSFSFFCTYRL